MDSTPENDIAERLPLWSFLQHAAHLADHVFPRLAVRQWVLAVPKLLRYFIQRDKALQSTVLRISYPR